MALENWFRKYEVLTPTNTKTPRIKEALRHQYFEGEAETNSFLTEYNHLSKSRNCCTNALLYGVGPLGLFDIGLRITKTLLPSINQNDIFTHISSWENSLSHVAFYPIMVLFGSYYLLGRAIKKRVAIINDAVNTHEINEIIKETPRENILYKGEHVYITQNKKE